MLVQLLVAKWIMVPKSVQLIILAKDPEPESSCQAGGLPIYQCKVLALILVVFINIHLCDI